MGAEEWLYDEGEWKGRGEGWEGEGPRGTRVRGCGHPPGLRSPRLVFPPHSLPRAHRRHALDGGHLPAQAQGAEGRDRARLLPAGGAPRPPAAGQRLDDVHRAGQGHRRQVEHDAPAGEQMGRAERVHTCDAGWLRPCSPRLTRTLTAPVARVVKTRNPHRGAPRRSAHNQRRAQRTFAQPGFCAGGARRGSGGEPRPLRWGAVRGSGSGGRRPELLLVEARRAGRAGVPASWRAPLIRGLQRPPLLRLAAARDARDGWATASRATPCARASMTHLIQTTSDTRTRRTLRAPHGVARVRPGGALAAPDLSTTHNPSAQLPAVTAPF